MIASDISVFSVIVDICNWKIAVKKSYEQHNYEINNFYCLSDV